MHRATICYTLIVSTLLLVSTQVMAFTLRLASVGQARSLFNFLLVHQSDIPTPTFLRLVAAQRTATIDLHAAYVREQLSTPSPRFAIIPEHILPSPRPAEDALPRYVRGVETRLLRDTQAVVNKPQR